MQTNRRGPKKAQMEPKNPMEPKNSTIYTPSIVSKFLYRLLDRPSIQTVLDPALGRGSLTEPWRSSGRTVLGCDIDPDSRPYADRFLLGKFEEVAPWPLARPDLIISNPPLNGHPKKELYPEVFLRHMIHLFGTDLPIVLFTSENLRLNHSLGGTRWRWLRDCGLRWSSSLALPRDIFPGTTFLVEVLFFNLPHLQPQYFLPDPQASQLDQERKAEARAQRAEARSRLDMP